MSPRQRSPAAASTGVTVSAEEVVAWLRRNGRRATRDGMARYAIPADRAFGVTVGELRAYAKQLGRSHELAAALWETGWYEARMLAAFVDEPERVTARQMDRWCAGFDSWAICDTVCFALFDRVPAAWERVEPWARRREEFRKRAAFALVWSLAVHDKGAANERFLACLPLVEMAAVDDRNFVKKGVDMALRAVGKRNAALRAAALELAARLAVAESASARWIGRSTQRDLNKARRKSA
jgi:3-methyladenine DNA glycosylase AlkD